jgi:hypothetical protein
MTRLPGGCCHCCWLLLSLLPLLVFLLLLVPGRRIAA